jgi:hypothetical protein
LFWFWLDLDDDCEQYERTQGFMSSIDWLW